MGIGLYIHIPFCKSKCKYCDFVSFSNKENLIARYIKCLKKELDNTKINQKLKTIYIGGGTPSFINSKYIKELLEKIQEIYKLDENVEITIEINPGTVDKDKLNDYKNAGINRLSIGLQSCNNNTLKRIGRIHKYEDFLNTYKLARDIGFENINVDLMLALPEQTMSELEDGVEKIINLNPQHISIYSLILEEDTILYNEVNSGKYVLPDEETERKMYWKIKEKLEEAGYIHYEISNFSKKGFESKHNLACWNVEEYIGIGAAAHSYINNIRYSNTNNIEEYIENYENGNEDNNFFLQEKLNNEDKMNEFMLLGLRKLEGVSIKKFKERFSENPIDIFQNSLNKLKKEGLIELNKHSIKLSNKGLDLANIVWEEFV